MPADILDIAYRATQAGRPFVIATVVRAEAPTSAKAGAKAIVTPDGALTGWVGGSCTQPTVIRESLKALADGQPRFLRLGPPELLRGDTPGVIEVPLLCVSGGTLDIYLDPHLPPPHLLLIGHLPVVEALAALASDMSFAVTVAGEGASAAQFPRAGQVQEFDAAQLRFTPQTYVVVASHGNYDEPALEAALSSDAPYVALVASRKRRQAVLDYLRGSGLPEARLARLRCPAGLDLGAVTPEEISLSILAEIVQLRRRGLVAQPAQATAPGLPASIAAMRPAAIPVPGPGQAVDPVCHMLVETATARFTARHNGRTYYFCAPGCKRTFERNPQEYVSD